MSDQEQDRSVEQLIAQLFDHMRKFREIYANQEETLAALSELVQGHTRGLRFHQAVIERLAADAGIPIGGEEPPPAAPSALN